MDNKQTHLVSVIKHINLVRIACNQINERLDNDIFGRISQYEIDTHDLSKFEKVELDGYIKQFYTDDKNRTEWNNKVFPYERHY